MDFANPLCYNGKVLFTLHIFYISQRKDCVVMVLSAVRELTVISVIIRILCAVILGGVLGF